MIGLNEVEGRGVPKVKEAEAVKEAAGKVAVNATAVAVVVAGAVVVEVVAAGEAVAVVEAAVVAVVDTARVGPPTQVPPRSKI